MSGVHAIVTLNTAPLSRYGNADLRIHWRFL